MSNLRLTVIALMLITAAIGIYRSAHANGEPLCEDVARYASIIARIEPKHRFGFAVRLHDVMPQDKAAIFKAENWLVVHEIPKHNDYQGAYLECAV